MAFPTKPFKFTNPSKIKEPKPEDVDSLIVDKISPIKRFANLKDRMTKGKYT